MPQISILMGSNSDWPVMQLAAETLSQLDVACEARVISAHRKHDRLREYVSGSVNEGVKVFIAGAGGAAHLPGVIAAMTTRPVIGVPIQTQMMGGLDSLLSIVQMPKGIPVATVATGKAGAINAALLGCEILALADPALAERLQQRRADEAAALSEIPE